MAARPVAILVALSFAPQLVSPAFAADEGSLKWIVGWLVGQAADNEGLVRALDLAGASREQGDAAFLAAVLDSYSTTDDDAAPDDLLVSLAGRLVRFCAPQVAPPSVVVVSIGSFAKHALDGAVSDIPGVIPSPMCRVSSRISVHDRAPLGRAESDYVQRSQGP